MIFEPIHRIPANVVFHMRVRDDNISGSNPYKWENVPASDLFAGKKIVLFSLPGAFTPTCSNDQLPGYERLYDQFVESGVDDVYCISVNDAFVMNAWARQIGIEKVKMIPDGNGEFTEKMGMLVNKTNFGFGKRSWRYAALIDDGMIGTVFEEKGKLDNISDDPYDVSRPEHVLDYIRVGSNYY